MKDTILCLCDLTGVMAQPWIDAGYNAILVDPQHPDGANIHVAYGVSGKSVNVTKVGRVIDDPLTWEVIRENLHRIAFVAAFPPCTDLAVSGARWFKHKADSDPAFQFKAMQVVWQCHNIAEMTGAPYFIENPVSRISSLWRKPDNWFHPWHFTVYEPEDSYTKKTCLWTGGGFIMPECHADTSLGEPDDRIHKCAPCDERANIRSATPRGFARAVFNSNGRDINEVRS